MLSSDMSVSYIKNATSPIVTVQKDGDSGNISTGSQTPSLQTAEQSSTFLHNISITGGPPSPTQNSICPFHILHHGMRRHLLTNARLFINYWKLHTDILHQHFVLDLQQTHLYCNKLLLKDSKNRKIKKM